MPLVADHLGQSLEGTHISCHTQEGLLWRVILKTNPSTVLSLPSHLNLEPGIRGAEPNITGSDEVYPSPYAVTMDSSYHWLTALQQYHYHDISYCGTMDFSNTTSVSGLIQILLTRLGHARSGHHNVVKNLTYTS